MAIRRTRNKQKQQEPFPGLDAYTRLGIVREGTKSILYRVLGPDGKSQYCLKLLKPSAIEIAEKLGRIGMRWEGEWNLLFDHPHIVRTFYSGKEGGRYYLLLEFLPGHNLLYHIHYEPGKLHGRRLELAHTMADTVTYVHEKGAIHRDVSPKNFMFDAQDELKLIDFGICISVHDRVLPRAGATGTPSYMAPEIIANKQYSVQTDIYALGVTLYELFTGRKPFPKVDVNSLAMQHLHVDIPKPSKLNPKVPQELETLILRCMAPKAADRFQRMADVAHILGIIRSRTSDKL